MPMQRTERLRILNEALDEMKPEARNLILLRDVQGISYEEIADILDQPVGTVNYTTSEDFTRITEFKNMTGQVVPGKTTIMREYSKAYTPGSGETPYYAILEDENLELYRAYRTRVDGLLNFERNPLNAAKPEGYTAKTVTEAVEETAPDGANEETCSNKEDTYSPND